MNVQQKTKGFTIIEVVLVLAIAGLIFLMVFIALPALQRSQRDSARKSEVGTVVSAIQSYMSNNRNTIPTEAQITQYVTGSTSATTLESGTTITRRSTAYTANVDPLTADLLGNATTGNNTLYQDQIKVWFGYKCGTSSSTGLPILVKGTTKQASVVVALESGPSSGSIYCQNN
ncbi:MAG: type II secretion system protein [Candidatus Microsaccharimonas sp.]